MPRENLITAFEALEPRQLLSAAVEQVVRPAIIAPAAQPSTSVQGYTPQEIRHAYGFDQVLFGDGKIQGDGSGQTIAIVDAYNDPNIASDLKVFDQQFGLPDAKLKVVGQTGSTTALPKDNSGWSQEIALDVEWAHAIAPGANILLVEAKSATLSDLMAAVNYAKNADGVSAVSMSWGTNEFYGQNTLDSMFTTPSGHNGVTFVAAAGDQGSWWGPSWPSSSSNVLSVGGTTLYTDSTGAYQVETGWSDSGGGVSSLEREPSYQSGAQQTGRRSAPDVAYDANPYTGFAVYSSVPYQGESGWMVAGGTSAGAPQWAALIAIANQGRSLNGLGTLDGRSDTLPLLYSVYSGAGTASAQFNDVASGRSSFFYSAHRGYDAVSGLGSPRADNVVALLAGTDAGQASTAGSKIVKRAVHQNVRVHRWIETVTPAPAAPEQPQAAPTDLPASITPQKPSTLQSPPTPKFTVPVWGAAAQPLDQGGYRQAPAPTVVPADQVTMTPALFSDVAGATQAEQPGQAGTQARSARVQGLLPTQGRQLLASTLGVISPSANAPSTGQSGELFPLAMMGPEMSAPPMADAGQMFDDSQDHRMLWIFASAVAIVAGYTMVYTQAKRRAAKSAAGEQAFAPGFPVIRRD